MHSCGRRQVRGYRGESVKPSIRDFQARSDVKLRPAEYAGEVTEAGSLLGEQALERESVGRHRDSHGCGQKANEIWPNGD
jgi:hypothetical protein